MGVNFDKTPWNAGPGELPGDDANEMARAVQCDECHRMFDPDEEGCFIGWHKSYGDVCQCARCVENARREYWHKPLLVECIVCGEEFECSKPADPVCPECRDKDLPFSGSF